MVITMSHPSLSQKLSYQSGLEYYETLEKNSFWTMPYHMTGLSFNIEVNLARTLCLLFEVEAKMRNLNYDTLRRACHEKDWRTDHRLCTIMALIYCKIEVMMHPVREMVLILLRS